MSGTEGAGGEPTRRARDDALRDDVDRLMLSTPHDYLGKIFNVPFALPAMTPKGFDAMIRRLSTVEPDADRPVSPDQDQRVPADGRGLDTPVPSVVALLPPPDGRTSTPETFPAPTVEAGSEIAASRRGESAKPTPLTEDELLTLSALAPLVRSPREAKRLLNLYRMLRSTKDLSGDSSRFLGVTPAEGEFRAVAVLLGLLSSNPRLLGQILFAGADPERGLLGGVCHRKEVCSWRVFVNGLLPRDEDGCCRNDLCADLPEQDRAEWEQLVERVAPATALVTLPDLAAFAEWAPHVARFSFLLAPSTDGRSR